MPLSAESADVSIFTGNGGSMYVGVGIHDSKLLGGLQYWLLVKFMLEGVSAVKSFEELKR